MSRVLCFNHKLTSLQSIRYKPLSSSLLVFGNLIRNMFITTQKTPNMNALQFFPGRQILNEGQSTQNFSDYRSTQRSPLARDLFKIQGVIGVFFGKEFVTVTKDDSSDWDALKPQVFAQISDFLALNQPVLLDQAINPDTEVKSDDSEVVIKIKDLLDTRIRPAVQEDGGDVYFHSFDQVEGIVWLKMAGACKTCSSSAITLKNGVENMMLHYIPEVREVKEYVDETEIKEETSHIH
eukprot:c2290_g1_i2.p1 GENE.c2290_g1_i2~~c2290_g1_i2.p1  ORF type:complete len:246 (+),score=88.16 c2290_g1_i2:29-739(+)